MFCPKCRGLMHPKGDVWVCNKCGYEMPMKQEDKDKKIVSEHEKKETAIIDREIETLPLDESVVCPRCGSRGAYWMLRQTRGADEPETRFYICKKCGHRWREY